MPRFARTSLYQARKGDWAPEEARGTVGSRSAGVEWPGWGHIAAATCVSGLLLEAQAQVPLLRVVARLDVAATAEALGRTPNVQGARPPRVARPGWFSRKATLPL
jgi:hypothetical protein